MPSTSISKIGGVVIITQVISQDENSMQLQDPSAATVQQATLLAADASPAAPAAAASVAAAAPAKIDDMTAIFLQGKPQNLGIVQIFIGVLSILFSLTVIISPLMIHHAPFCLGVFFVISGSLVVAAGKRTTIRLVWASLVSNIISTVISFAGIPYLSWQLIFYNIYIIYCDSKPSWLNCKVHLYWTLGVTISGLMGFLIILLFMQSCVSITVCVFSGKTIRYHNRCPRSTLTHQVIEEPSDDVASNDGSDVSLLVSNDEEGTELPPNSP